MIFARDSSKPVRQRHKFGHQTQQEHEIQCTHADDAITLRKRARAEGIIDQLNNIFQVENSRHRSPKNFLTNLYSALIAYNLTEKKP